MIRRSFLSGSCFFLFREADKGGAAGGAAGETKPEAGEEIPNELPKPEGDTIENKLTSATGLLGKFFNLAKDLKSRLGTSENERTRLESQFNAVSEDLRKEKDEHGQTKNSLGEANTKVTGLTTERDLANNNVGRLEKLCNLRGIDPATVVPASTSAGGAASSSNALERYKELDAQERAGTIANGSAFKFYQANKEAIDKASAAV